MNCQEIQERLLAHKAGELDDAAAAGLRQHLETCAACRAAAEETERILDLMRSAFAAGPAAPARLDERHRIRVLRAQFAWPSYRKIIFQIAAVLLVAFVLGELWWPAGSGFKHKTTTTTKLGGTVAEMTLADARPSRIAAAAPTPLVEKLQTTETGRREADVSSFNRAAAKRVPLVSAGSSTRRELKSDPLQTSHAAPEPASAPLPRMEKPAKGMRAYGGTTIRDSEMPSDGAALAPASSMVLQKSSTAITGKVGAVRLHGGTVQTNDAQQVAVLDLLTLATADKAPAQQPADACRSGPAGKAELRILERNVANQVRGYPAILGRGTPDEIKAEAIRVARQDIAAGQMRICIAGTRGTSAAGVPPGGQTLIKRLPLWQMPCGCTEPLALAGITFAEAYNRAILKQLENKP